MGSTLGILDNIDAATFLAFTVCLLVGYYLSVSRARLPYVLDGPRQFPVVGNLPQMLWHRSRTPHMYRLFDEWRSQYGDMFQISVGSRSIVMVYGKHYVRDVLLTQGHAYINRPGIYIINRIFRGLGVVFSNGHPWKEMRRFSMSSMRDFGVGKKSLEGRIQDEARIVMDEMERQTGPFIPKRMYLESIANIICGIVFGNRFEYTDPDFQKLLDFLEYLGQNAGIEMPENILPILAYIPGLSKGRVMIEKDMEMRRFIQRGIEEHRLTYDPDNIRDFLDLYLRTAEDESDSSIYTEDNVFRTIIDLFTAGSETTATGMAWLTLYMCVYPEVQKKCQQEIDKVVGSGRMVALTDRAELVYVMATIQELLRVANIAPSGLPRETTQEVQLGCFVLPKGTMVIPSLRSVNLDPEDWPEPEVFRPDRWIDDAGNIRKSDVFLPFSAGPRSCLGEPLARMEMFLFFSNILQRFSIRLPDGTTPQDLCGYQNGVVHHPFEYEILVSRR